MVTLVKKHSSTRTICSASAALVLVCWSAQSAAGPAEDNVIGAFESFCLDNLNMPERTIRLIDALGLPKIAEPDRAILMDDHPGWAWISSGENKKYFIKLSTEGVCYISSPFADGNAVRKLFEKLSRSKVLSTESVGSETQTIFAVTHPDRRGSDDGHAIVMVQSSELQSGGAGLTSVPEKAAKAEGLTVPQVWP
jgi:hypothetical protein